MIAFWFLDLSNRRFKNKLICLLEIFQKRMRIKKLPTILALHLKRFKYMEQYNRHIKVSHRVVFPLELRLFNTVRNRTNTYFVFILHHIEHCFFPQITVRWCCESRSHVWSRSRGYSLRFRPKSRSLYFHRQVLRILVNFWRS